VVAIVLATLCRSGDMTPAAALSGDVIWSEPVNLSNSPESSGNPAVVTDDYGYVHVFWSEDVGGEPLAPEERGHSSNTIMHSRWDGVAWTLNSGILSVPGDGVAAFVAVDIDADNRLHAVWTGQSDFYYSSAPSWQAHLTEAWSTPAIVAEHSARSMWQCDIVADDSGSVHVIYATRGDETGVYHTWSKDGGMTWRSPTLLSGPLEPPEKGYANVRAISDGSGRLQSVWQSYREGGFGQAVYHAHTTSDIESWSGAVQLRRARGDETYVSWPYITARSQTELHLIYANGTNKGRAHRVSTDGGETWGEAQAILMDMEGINGFVIPIIDGSGQMNLIVNMRTRATQIVGLYYARWLGAEWSPVLPAATDGPQAAWAHFTAAAVRLGNELHVVWKQNQGGEVWHMSGTVQGIDAAPARSLPLTPPPTPTPTATMPTATPRRSEVSRQELADLVESPPVSAPAFSPLLVGGGVALLVILVVIVSTRTRSK